MQKVSSLFFAAVLREVPRLLGQIDRNPLSSTYGSCDRAFWLYRTNDISSMRYQEAALTLALLYMTPFEGNEYYGDARTRELANAVIRFACKRQRADGSFDEWYVYEGSFVCTAFVSAALGNAGLVLGQRLDCREELKIALRKSGAWLMNHTETMVMNQLAGSMAALAATHEITGDIKYERAAKAKCEELLKSQTGEGWWYEYGGPDAGYLSLTVDYLSRYNARFPDPRVEGAIERASAFLSHFIHPDGTAGGEYFSRNTEYLIPSGFVRAAPYSPSARYLARTAAGLLSRDAGIQPRTLDDRYLCYILYNWIEAGVLWQRLQTHSVDSPKRIEAGRVFLPLAGLFVQITDAYRLYGNLRKGGSLRLYARDALLIDSGIAIRHRGGIYASNVLDPKTRISFAEDGRTLVSEGRLLSIRALLLSTGRAVIFKALLLTIGRIPLFQVVLKRALRVVSILRPGSRSELRFERSVTLTDRSITIMDTASVALPKDAFFAGKAVLYALVPSSRYESAHLLKPLAPAEERFEVIGETSRLIRTFAL